VPEMATPEIASVFDQQWLAFLTAGEQSGEYTLRRPDGTTRDVEFRAVAHVLPGTHLSILRDVTERGRLERARRYYVQRLEILSAIDRAILDARSPMTVADALVRMASSLFPTIHVALIVFDWGKRTACHVAVWSEQPTRIGPGTEMPMREDAVGAEVLEGRSFVRSHLDDQVRLTGIEGMLFNEGVRSLLWVPLRGKIDIMGALNISSADRDGFDSEHVVVAQEVADRVAAAITSARLFEDLEASNKRVAGISKRLLEVQEVERRDVARELHDEIGQMLTGVNLRLDLEIKKAAAPMSESLAECSQLVQELVSRVRRLSLNLRPPLLDELGLQKALFAHFERYTAQTSVPVAFASSGLSDKRFAVVVETAAFRIIQESLTNIARHAAADRAEVEVRVTEGRVYVRVTDRGSGFTEASSTPAGAGLSGMQERIALLGGLFHVSSVPGQGTTVEAQIPLSEPDCDRS
jgi:signal transduction histidine kinase